MRWLVLNRTTIFLLVLLPAALRAQPSPPQPHRDDAALGGPLQRSTLVREALRRSPGLRAAEGRAAATSLEAEAEGSLPPPELEFGLVQVPLAQPWNIPGAQMIMLGLTQPIPAPGSLEAKSDAKLAEADAERSMAGERRRELTREVGHAFTDYVQAKLLLRARRSQRDATGRILDAARVRVIGGGMLSDVAQAQVELAQSDAEIASDEGMVLASQARLNGLLLRPHGSLLGEPVVAEPEALGEPVEAVMARARRTRPEVAAADARRTAALARVRAAESEAAWPMFSVGLQYYAPTTSMPELTAGSYGVSFSSTLPWLWGRASSTLAAEKAKITVEVDEAADVQARIATEVASLAAEVERQARRYRALRDGTLPAAKFAVEAAAQSYAGGGTNVLGLLMANRSVVETEVAMVEVRVALDHALVELDWAAGAPVKRAPIPAPPAASAKAEPSSPPGQP